MFSLVILLVLSLIGCKNSSNSDRANDNHFTWWIIGNDSPGQLYEKYEENVAIQWINNQYWDNENLTLGSKDKEKKLKFNFRIPIRGAEPDNFNTMVATGEYPEKYLPNYVSLIEENPEIKPFVTHTDEEGKTRYYSLYAIADNIIQPWQGTMYRRDWVVKYADPTPYIWDLESDYVKDNGHPKYTPLSVAEEMDDYTGWKVNEVTEFTSNEGDDPDNDYKDNVVYPSGKSDPYTISDWEWMFEAFQKAIDERGFSQDTDAYCTTLYYPGFLSPGDLVSSFGGGGPQWYIHQNGEATFGGDSENFKTYIEAMHTWYEKGWLDTKFESRASSLFWEINHTGVGQGKVGLWTGGQGMFGTAIRATSINEEDQKDAMVFGASLPINDVYGNEEAKYIEPYTMYQQNILGPATGFTTKCEGKDLEALFAMINYFYTREGSLKGIGLNEEQYASMDFEPDLYKEIDIDAACKVIEDENGIINYKYTIPADQELSIALKALRLGPGLQTEGNPDKGYIVDMGFDNILNHAVGEWTRYKSTGYIQDYNTIMSDKDSDTYNKIETYVNDYMAQVIPEMIKKGLNNWDDYVTTLNKYGPDQVTDIYQELINQ